jgi:hypothetical protein
MKFILNPDKVLNREQVVLKSDKVKMELNGEEMIDSSVKTDSVEKGSNGGMSKLKNLKEEAQKMESNREEVKVEINSVEEIKMVNYLEMILTIKRFWELI